VADKKGDVLEMLRELAELTTLDEGNVQAFRVRAYESAHRAVEAHTGDIAALDEAALQKLDGIGKSTAAKIRELVVTGKVARLEELRAKHPASVTALMRLPGLGPKAVLRLRAELGIESLDDLRAAIAARKLRDLRGFGARTEEKLARSIERLGLGGAERRTPIASALPVAERVVAELVEVPGVVRAAFCGSLRRYAETIGDVDIVVAADRAEPAMDRLVALPMIDRVLGRGDTKASVVTRKGLQIDLRVVRPHQLGAAMMYFTGSKAHNIKLRHRAMTRGLLLNEYGLQEEATGRVVASETEEQVYAALGLPWIHPVLREDTGEIELAERGELPRGLEPADLTGDLHVHTSLSGDGRSSLEDVVSAARARGYRFLALTDHAEGLPMQGVTREGLLAQRERLAALQRELGDELTLLHGIELNIGPAGELDYDLEFRRQFDWCLASVHDHFELDRDAQTRRIVTAMADPTVNMIGHLSARTIGKRPPIDLDVDAVIDASARTGAAIEVNGALPRLDASVDVLRRSRGRGVTYCFTSDSHHTTELDRVRHACQHALRAWVDPACVANGWSRDRFLAWVRQKRAA
jgi:DNA polymerase (family 10)